jgi:hypothetical protein
MVRIKKIAVFPKPKYIVISPANYVLILDNWWKLRQYWQGEWEKLNEKHER